MITKQSGKQKTENRYLREKIRMQGRVGLAVKIARKAEKKDE